MFVQPVALEKTPAFAEVPESVIVAVLSRMTGGQAPLRDALQDAFRTMERTQPALAEHLCHELAEVEHPAAQTLTYFLFAVIYLAFEEAFGPRLACIEAPDIGAAMDRLILDGELRHAGAAGATYSEDMIALGQPALVRMIRSEVDGALDQASDRTAFEEVDPVYETLLLEILLLSQAVAPA